MFKFFDTFLDYLSIFGDFIVSFFTNLLMVIKQIGIGSSAIMNVVVNYLPDIVSGIAICIISYAIIINTINKGG